MTQTNDTTSTIVKALDFEAAMWLLAEADVLNRDDLLQVTATVIGETVASLNDLTGDQLYTLVNTFRQWKETDKLGQKVTDILNMATMVEFAAEQDAAERDVAG